MLGLDHHRLLTPIDTALDHMSGGIAHNELLPDARHGCQQAFRVVGLRIVEDLVHAPLLDHMTAIHDDHLIGEIGHNTHVVRDDEHRGTEFVAGETQQIEDLGLHRHVECRRRLIGENESGIEHEGHGDDDALLLAARELMRVVVDARGGVRNANLLKNLD